MHLHTFLPLLQSQFTKKPFLSHVCPSCSSGAVGITLYNDMTGHTPCVFGHVSELNAYLKQSPLGSVVERVTSTIS